MERSANSQNTLRTQILEYAWKEFKRVGIRRVKVDDLSAHFSISKRTLYEMFDDKQNLVVECFKQQYEQGGKVAEQIINGSINSLEIFVNLFVERISEIEDINPVFFTDVFKYPKLMEFYKQTADVKDQTVLRIIEKCVADGYMIPGFDYQMLLETSNMQFMNVIRFELYNKYSLVDIISTLQIVFFRGCCTAEGIKLLDEHIAKLRQKN